MLRKAVGFSPRRRKGHKESFFLCAGRRILAIFVP
jgi:hypothetical protein